MATVASGRASARGGETVSLIEKTFDVGQPDVARMERSGMREACNPHRATSNVWCGVAAYPDAGWRLHPGYPLTRDIWTQATTAAEREEVLAALAQCGRWVVTYFGWRPNLDDEADNHLIELAVAGGAEAIVTHNVSDLTSGDLRWERPRIATPAQCLEMIP